LLRRGPRTFEGGYSPSQNIESSSVLDRERGLTRGVGLEMDEVVEM